MGQSPTVACHWAGKVARAPPPCPSFWGVPPSPRRTEHHPWPLLRSLRDCEGQGCERTHHGESPRHILCPHCPQAGRVSGPPYHVPSYWGSHHHLSGLSIIPGPCQGHQGTAVDKGVRGHSVGTIFCCDLPWAGGMIRLPAPCPSFLGIPPLPLRTEHCWPLPRSPQAQVSVRTWPPAAGHQPHQALED